MGNDYTQREIDRLHEELQDIYSRGLLTPQEEIKTKGIWARIERLESSRVAASVREDREAAILRARVEEAFGE